MDQLELFEKCELVPIKQFLTVWNEAERTRRLEAIKKPRADCLGKREVEKG